MTQQVGYETVNHPNHYNAYGVECIVVAEQMSYNQGTALAYIWRCGLKPGVDPIEDLRKAIWHLQREIERLESEKRPLNRPVLHQADVYGEK